MSRRYQRFTHIFEQPGYDIPPGEFYGGIFLRRARRCWRRGYSTPRRSWNTAPKTWTWPSGCGRWACGCGTAPRPSPHQHYQKELPALTRDVRAEGQAEVALVGKHPALWAAPA